MSASRFARCPGALPASPRPALAALLALLLAACGGGGGEPTPPAPEGRAGALAAARPGELASWAQGRLRALDAQGRLAGGGSFGAGIGAAAPISGALAAAPPSSRTLVQEDGVDEADLLRSTGSTLHALSRDDAGGLVLIAQPMGAAGRLGEALRVPLARDDAWQQPEGLMARSDGQALVAVSRRQEALAGSALCPDCVSIAPMWLKQGVQLQHIDTRDAARPVAGTRLSFDGSLVEYFSLVSNHPSSDLNILPTDAAYQFRTDLPGRTQHYAASANPEAPATTEDEAGVPAYNIPTGTGPTDRKVSQAVVNRDATTTRKALDEDLLYKQ